MVASALSAVEGVGNVIVERDDTLVTLGSASWTYTIDFVSITGDVNEVKVGYGEHAALRHWQHCGFVGRIRWSRREHFENIYRPTRSVLHCISMSSF